MHHSNMPIIGKTAPWFARIGLGLVLVGYGVNHYRFLPGFREMAAGAVGPLGPLAGILAYIVPLLMIVGGALFAIKQLGDVAKFCILASLGGILAWAGLGVLLGTADAGSEMMPMIVNTLVLLIGYHIVKKMSCCGCTSGSNCAPVK